MIETRRGAVGEDGSQDWFPKWFAGEKERTSGAKSPIDFGWLTARLKPSPFKTKAPKKVFSQPVHAVTAFMSTRLQALQKKLEFSALFWEGPALAAP